MSKTVYITRNHILRGTDSVSAAGIFTGGGGGGGITDLSNYYTKTDTDTLLDLKVALAGAETITGIKTFYNGQKINNPANTFAYTITSGAITANRILNLPVITGTDTLATLGLAQTFSAVKTFSDNIIYAVDNGVDWDLKPVSKYGFGLRLRPNAVSGGDANRFFQIGRWDNANSYASLVHINEYGKVGILNTAPDEVLDVTGNIQYSGYLKGDELKSKTTAFVSGFTGAGFKLIDSAGDSNMTLDNLTVRKQMNIYELIIHTLKSINGGMLISYANHKILSVSEEDDEYTCTIDTDDGNIGVGFEVNDKVRCQKWTGRGVKYYGGTVLSVGADNFVLEITDGAGTPAADDDVIHTGNTTDTDRQGLIYLTASETNSPYIDVLDGVTEDTFVGKTKVRIGKLDGIGALTGYGLYGQNVDLTGKITATSGEIGGFTIHETDGLYAGAGVTRVQMKAGAGFWAGATAIGDAPFYVTAAGVAKFNCIDSIFKATTIPIGDLSGVYTATQINVVGHKRKDRIVLSGLSGTAQITCDVVANTVTFTSDLSTSAANFVNDFAAAYLAAGVVLTNDGGTLYFESTTEGLDFVGDTTIVNTGGDIDGAVTTLQVSVTPVARIDTIALSGTSGTAKIIADGDTTTAVWNDDGLSAVAVDYVNTYYNDFDDSGITVTSSDNDIIFTAQVAGTDFTGATSVANLANPYRGSVKIHGNEIWENDQNDDTTGAIWINRKGYDGGTSKYRGFYVGDGKGGMLAGFVGASAGSTIYLLAEQLQIPFIPTSSDGLTDGSIWRDGTALKIKF